MEIWVDADACPVVVRDILYKAAMRTQTQMTLVANRSFRIPKSPLIQFVRVAPGLDVADNEIAQNVQADDLVITSDIPLAAIIVKKGAIGLNPRGDIYTSENIHEKLSARDFMDSLRSSGIETGGPPALTQRDRQSFANSLDKLLSRYKK